MGKYITDHALVRYMERVKGIDVEAIRSEMVSEELVLGLHAGVRKCFIAGFEWRCAGGKVVTIVDPKGYHPKQGGKRNNKRYCPNRKSRRDNG